MGREVRRVAADWKHPLDENDNCIPLIDGIEYAVHVSSYELAERAWLSGDTTELVARYGEWAAASLMEHEQAGHMPRWTAEQRTHVQLYENTTEGTPFSPVFATLEELAEWLCGEPEGFDHQQELEFLRSNISGERPWD